MNFNVADGKLIQISAVYFSQLNEESNNAPLFHKKHKSKDANVPDPAIVYKFLLNMFPWMRQGGGF